ncbi:hypothetical protein CH379_002035 [Leptospira ellisii]|nr:hypothetical protein [Leptospira ellisii]MDV6234407.1 hypothetical protein [Leptospira ellisii]
MLAENILNFNNVISKISKIIFDRNKITSFVIVGLFCFTNCQKGNGNQNDFLLSALFSLGTQKGFNISTRIQDSNSVGSANASSFLTQSGFGGTATPVTNDNVQGLYVSTLLATAFDYRPGETEQESDPIYRIDAPDWSYWMIAPPPGFPHFSNESYEKAIGNVLQVGGQIQPDWYQSSGISGDRNFEIDAFSLTLEAPGLVYNNEYYGILWGENASGIDGKHPLKKYSQWAEAPTHLTQLVFPGFHYFQDVPGQSFVTDASITVLFIRNDILTAPAQIQMTEESYSSKGYNSIGYASRTLTSAENDFVLSMLKQTYPLMYHTNIVLIPFDGPITIVFDGETNEAEKRFLWKDVDVQIGLDLSNILDTDPLNSNLENLLFTMKADANNVPFGLNMKVLKKEPVYKPLPSSTN